MPDNIVEVKIQADATGVEAGTAEASAAVSEAGGTLSGIFAKITEAGAACVESVTEFFKRMGESSREMAVEVGESLRETGEELAEFGEKAKFTSLQSASAFNALGGLLGGGIIAGALGEMLAKTEEQVIETNHLSEATGVSVSAITAWKDVIRESGGRAGQLDVALARLARSMAAAVNEGGQISRAFQDLGVDTAKWAEKMPAADEVLLQISDHLHKSADATRDLGDAETVLGRGSLSTVAILKQGREELEKGIAAHKAHGDAVQASVESAKELTRAEAQMGENFQKIVVESFPVVVAGLKTLTTAFIGIKLVLEEIGDVAGAVFATISEGASASFRAMSQAVHGNLADAENTMRVSAGVNKEIWKQAFASMKNDAADAHAEIKALWEKPPAEPEAKESKKPTTGSSQEDLQKRLQGEQEHWGRVLAIRIKAAEDLFQEGKISAAQLKDIETLLNSELLSSEQKFLQERIAALDKGDTAYLSKVQELNNEIVRAKDQAAARQQEIEFNLQKSFKKAQDEIAREGEQNLREMNKAQEEHLKTTEKAFDAELKAAKKSAADREKAEVEAENSILEHQIAGLELTLTYLEKEAAARKIPPRQAMEAEAEAVRVIEGLRQQIFSNDQSLYAKGSAEWQKYENDKVKVADETAKKLQGLALTNQKVEETLWNQTQKKIQSDFNNTLERLTTGEMRFREAWRSLTADVAKDFIAASLKMVEQKALEVIEKTALERMYHTVLQALHIEDAAAGRAASTANAMSQVTQQAGIGFAAAYASTSAIPIIGPELAPGVAAATMAAILGGGLSLASAAGGMDRVPNDMLMMVHKDESIMSAPLAQHVRDSVGNGNSGGGGHTFNVHYHAHGKQSSAAMRENAAFLAKELKRQMRYGAA